MSAMNTDISARETRLRLLNAAGEEFAEKGFKSATVRAICDRAGANVAAVNYHFGDKERLYSEVLRFAHACAVEKHPPTRGIDHLPPPRRLREFIHAFLRRVFDEGRPAWHGKLMSREMFQPTAALDDLVKHEIKPRYCELGEIISQLLGPGADEQLIRRCGESVVGQCIFFHHARPMLERLHPEDKFDSAAIEERAEHIFRFSLAAMKGLARGLKEVTHRSLRNPTARAKGAAR